MGFILFVFFARWAEILIIIDFLVDFKEGRFLFDLIRLNQELELLFGRPVDMVTTDEIKHSIIHIIKPPDLEGEINLLTKHSSPGVVKLGFYENLNLGRRCFKKMNKKKNIKFRRVVILVVLVLLAVPVFGFAGSAEISVNVTPATVGVTVTPETVGYGVLPLGAVSDVKSVTATNTGNTAADLQIQGANATATGSTWNLGTVQDKKIFTHEFKLGDATDWNNLTTDTQNLKENVAADADVSIDLQLGMPTFSANNAEHETSVTIVAIMSE